MSSKTRMLGAGRAGSTAYGSNVSMVQFGDKLQGIAPTATHFFISGNGKAGWTNYQTRTYAPKREVVFCMNQLGGVGRGKSQFKVGGLNRPDGARRCVSGSDSLLDRITFLQKYFQERLPGYVLCLVGTHESVQADIKGCACFQDSFQKIRRDPFLHFTDSAHTRHGQPLPATVRAVLDRALKNTAVSGAVQYVNSLCSSITGWGCSGQFLGFHTLGCVPRSDIGTFQECGYGQTEWHGLNVYSWDKSTCSWDITGNEKDCSLDDNDTVSATITDSKLCSGCPTSCSAATPVSCYIRDASHKFHKCSWDSSSAAYVEGDSFTCITQSDDDDTCGFKIDDDSTEEADKWREDCTKAKKYPCSELSGDCYTACPTAAEASASINCYIRDESEKFYECELVDGSSSMSVKSGPYTCSVKTTSS